MVSRLRAAAIGLAILGLAEAPPAVFGQATPAPEASEQPAAKKPAARRRRRPMSEAVEKAVDEVMRRHYDPCALASQKGVPCFPTGVDVVGPRFSVADAMRKYRTDGRRAEGAAITASDMREQMGGKPLSQSGGVSLDPICTVKSLIRRMSGTGKFYLYSLADGRGEHRPVLTDRKIDAAVYATNPQAVYEYLGEYQGECEAIAAWRKALREAVAPPPVDESDGRPAVSVAPAAPAAPVAPADDEVTVQDRAVPPPGGTPPP